jgi:hypothetical protein
MGGRRHHDEAESVDWIEFVKLSNGCQGLLQQCGQGQQIRRTLVASGLVDELSINAADVVDWAHYRRQSTIII